MERRIKTPTGAGMHAIPARTWREWVPYHDGAAGVDGEMRVLVARQAGVGDMSRETGSMQPSQPPAVQLIIGRLFR